VSALEAWVAIGLAYLIGSRILARVATGSWLGTPADYNDSHNVPAHSRGFNGPDDWLILFLRRRFSDDT
jgi:hypothetical protein